MTTTTVKRGSTPLKISNVNKAVFQESKFGIKNNKKFLQDRQAKRNSFTEIPLALPTQETQDKIDAQNDQQVTSILDLLKKIEDFNGSQLEGNERRKYIQKKLIELGVKAPKAPNHSFKVRMAMKKAAEERQKEEKENARYAGMLAGVKSKRKK